MTLAEEFGINFPLGGPEGPVFSSHVLERFGGREAALRDLGGYLQDYSRFLNEHLETARQVEFDDLLVLQTPQGVTYRSDDHRRTKSHLNNPAVWDASDPIMFDVTKSHQEVADALGVSRSAVYKNRRRLGVETPVERGGKPPLCDWPATLAEHADLTNKEIADIVGCDRNHVGFMRKKLGFKSPKATGLSQRQVRAIGPIHGPPKPRGPRSLNEPPLYQRLVPRLSEVEGLAAPAAADVLGCSPAVVKRARAYLRTRA